MIRKALRGERPAVLTFLGLGAVLCLLVASLALSLSYKQQAHDFQRTLYDRCLTRLQYDNANHASVAADVNLYESLLEQNARVPDSAIPPDLRDIAREQRRSIERALAEKRQAFKAGIPGDCEALK